MAFVEGSNPGTLNNTSLVTLVAAPAASTRRIIKSIFICNRDTAAAEVTVYYVDGGNQYEIEIITLQPKQTLSVLANSEVQILDTTNRSIQAALTNTVATKQPTFTTAYGDAS